MPTSIDMRNKLRAFLDDEQSDWKKGGMWSDTELNLALDAAQLQFARYSYLKEQYHLLARLHTSISGSSPVTLPVNYMFYGSATVQSSGVTHPAVLYIGWSGSLFAGDQIRYTAYIKASTVQFLDGLTPATGTLYYYRRPVKVDTGTSHTDFTDPCYDVIMYHAAAILQQKDWGQCQRALKNMVAIMTTLANEPFGMYPEKLNQNKDA
jgi:hypothetical protein